MGKDGSRPTDSAFGLLEPVSQCPQVPSTVWESLEGTDDQNVRNGGAPLTNYYIEVLLTAATRPVPTLYTASGASPYQSMRLSNPTPEPASDPQLPSQRVEYRINCWTCVFDRY